MKVSNQKLAIGFPLSFPMVHSDFFIGCYAMEKPDCLILREDNGPIDVLRNNLVLQAMQNNCSHIIFMDTDMVYHPETITRLLSHKLPIVGALCYRRYPPFDPLCLQGDPVQGYESIDNWEKDELIEVDATGTGCLLFSMSVFHKMPSPWFKFRDNPDKNIGGVIGEDIGFCWDLKRAGYKIYVDTSVPSKHLTTLAVNDATYRLYKTMKIQQKEKAAKTALSNNKGGN